jgi:hypothetical protein
MLVLHTHGLIWIICAAHKALRLSLFYLILIDVRPMWKYTRKHDAYLSPATTYALQKMIIGDRRRPLAGILSSASTLCSFSGKERAFVFWFSFLLHVFYRSSSKHKLSDFNETIIWGFGFLTKGQKDTYFEIEKVMWKSALFLNILVNYCL